MSLGVQIYHCLEKFTFFQKGEASLYKISVCTVFGDNPQKIKFEKKKVFVFGIDMKKRELREFWRIITGRT